MTPLLMLLVDLLILFLVVALIWYAIGLIPFPAPVAALKWVLYVILIIVTIVILISLLPGHLLTL